MGGLEEGRTEGEEGGGVKDLPRISPEARGRKGVAPFAFPVFLAARLRISRISYRFMKTILCWQNS